MPLKVSYSMHNLFGIKNPRKLNVIYLYLKFAKGFLKGLVLG